LAIIPTFLEIAVPMAALLGVLLAFARLSGDSEIIVIRASGISITRLIAPVLMFGVVALSVGFFISMYARPWGYQTLSKSLFAIARTKSTAGLDKGVFNKLGKLTLYTDEIDHFTGQLKNVVIDDRRSTTEAASSERKVVFASSGSIITNEASETITFDLRNGVIHEMNAAGEYVITQFQANKTVMKSDDVFNPDASEGERENRELTNQQLASKSDRIASRIKELETNRDISTDKDKLSSDLKAVNARLAEHGILESDDNEKDPIDTANYDELQKLRRSSEVESARRISFPFASLCMALLGLPLGIQTPRTQKTWGIGLSVVLGLLGFIFYFALLTIGVTAAEKGSLAPQLGVWLPNLGTVAVGLTLIYLVGSERWQTVGDGSAPLLGAFISPLVKISRWCASLRFRKATFSL
jgi:lipopolysaccharide export system permease protein